MPRKATKPSKKSDEPEVKLEEVIREPEVETVTVKEASLKFDSKLVKKAVGAVQQLVELNYKDKQDLFANPSSEPIFANVVLNKLPSDISIRPIPIKVPNSVHLPNTRVCLIVKDPKSDFKELGLNFSFPVKVLMSFPSLIVHSSLELRMIRSNGKRDCKSKID